MSRKRVIYAVDPVHEVPHDELADAIGYLGGVLVEDHNHERPSEVIVQWSPLTAKRMRPQRAREVYSGWRAIPVPVVAQIMAAYAERLADEQATKPPPKCRRCFAKRGTTVLATHDACDADGRVLAARSLCAYCYGVVTKAKVPPPPLRMADKVCKRCSTQLYLVPNVREQIRVAGRFTGLCPKCWTSKKSGSYLNDHNDD